MLRRPHTVSKKSAITKNEQETKIVWRADWMCDKHGYMGDFKIFRFSGALCVCTCFNYCGIRNSELAYLEI